MPWACSLEQAHPGPASLGSVLLIKTPQLCSHPASRARQPGRQPGSIGQVAAEGFPSSVSLPRPEGHGVPQLQGLQGWVTWGPPEVATKETGQLRGLCRPGDSTSFWRDHGGPAPRFSAALDIPTLTCKTTERGGHQSKVNLLVPGWAEPSTRFHG